MDLEETEYYEDKLSEILSDLLTCQGFSIERTNLIRSKCLLFEKIYKDFYGRISIHCGSEMAEASGIIESDQDIMRVLPGFLVVNEDCNVVDDKLVLLTVLLDNCIPGYTRLRVNRLNDENISLIEITEKDGNSTFLSSKKLLEIKVDSSRKVWPKPFRNRISHNQGPCETVEIWGTDNDLTIGIECQSWPVAAIDWIKRPRFKDWPLQCIINKIASLPVHVVPVGDPRSSYSSTQWRFSFNYAERELFWTFNDIQIQCYVLLKSVFKGKLKPFSPDNLRGYQMKNLIFWISEEYGVTIFTKKNLLRCLELCLKTYKDQISHNFLPHYILLDRNLIANKLDLKTRQLILDKISKILDNIFLAIVECRHHISGGSEYLSKYDGSVRHFICHVLTELYYKLENFPRKFKFQVFSQCHAVIVAIAYTNKPVSVRAILDLIDCMKVGNQFSDTILPYMLKTATSFCFILKGMIICQNTNANNPKIHLASFEFDHGIDFGEFSGLLYKVTFLLFINNIEKAWSILLPVLNHTKPFICSGGCFEINQAFKNIFQFSKTRIVNIETKSVKYEELSNCYEIVFPIYVVNFVPEPIKYELYVQLCTQPNFSCCVYDPVVYAFYLMFEITGKRGGQMSETNEILSRLSKYIEDFNRYSGLHLFRAYTLLGFCYYKCGRIKEAIATFRLSLQKQIDKNAA
ncbi:Hypothetical predicted protein, partial [Mytilus galloprovincialis]